MKKENYNPMKWDIHYALYARYHDATRDKNINESMNGKVKDIVFETFSTGHHDSTNIGSHFLRKGFNGAVIDADENVIVPIVVDSEGNEVSKKLSKEEIRKGSYENDLSIKGFNVVRSATDEQIKAEYAKVVRSFVSASINPDLTRNGTATRKYYIRGIDYTKECAYSNGGDDNEKIYSGNVLKKLNLFGLDWTVDK